MLIRQDRAELELDVRHGGVWASEVLRGPEARLVLADFGLSCALADIYRNTPVLAAQA